MQLCCARDQAGESQGRTGAICIRDADHLRQFVIRRILAHGCHQVLELFRIDAAATILHNHAPPAAHTQKSTRARAHAYTCTCTYVVRMQPATEARGAARAVRKSEGDEGGRGGQSSHHYACGAPHLVERIEGFTELIQLRFCELIDNSAAVFAAARARLVGDIGDFAAFRTHVGRASRPVARFEATLLRPPPPDANGSRSA